MPDDRQRPATLASAFAIAWPASLAAIVTPLLGLIDAAVLARGADTEALAGASLAGAVFSLLYWTFGFLRMSLSGLTAQALGSNDEVRLRAHLLQGAALGALIGSCLLLLTSPIGALAQWVLVDSSEASRGAGEAMRTYLWIRLLAAPAALTTTAVLGWLTGQGRTRLLMAVTTGTAGINASLSILFVLELDWGIAGLAAATAIAELSGLLIAGSAVALILRQRGGIGADWNLGAARRDLGSVLSLNRDIFIRSAILTFVIASFTRFGAGFGDLTVAANHVLLNLVLTVTLLLDGAAIAAETLVGQALGARRDRQALFEAAWRRTTELAAGAALFLCLGLFAFGPQVVDLALGKGPGNALLQAEALRYLPWAAISPLVVAAAFQLDGIFIGATQGRILRNTMLAAGLFYFAFAFLLVPTLGNHGLWAAFLLFMAARGGGLILHWKKVGRLPAA